MPKRFLKPGITTSEHWNNCSFEAQSFYIRLITLVDDFGRYDGRLQVLKSHAFPLSDKLTADHVEKLCIELSKNDLAIFYVVDNKTVMQLQRWEETARSAPKFQAFDSNCEQLYADANNCNPRARTRSSSSSSSSSSLLLTTASEIYQEYPKKVNKEEALKAIVKALQKTEAQQLRERTALFAQCVRGCDMQFVPYPASWFNAGGYDSDPEVWKNIGREREATNGKKYVNPDLL